MIVPEQARETDPGSGAFIQVSHLSKTFGSYVALNDVSIVAGEGSTLVLLGPSGCGKTTMLRCIAGLEHPDAGSIEIDGISVFDAKRGIDLKPERRDLGIVFQSYAVWPHMTVAANVGFPLKVRDVPREEIVRRVDKILSIVGLAAWHDRPATDLSGGQQQRVAFARALIHEPRLVLFDEPMSNLDAQLRDQMRIELKLLQQQFGFTAVYVTHDQAEAFGLAQTVVVMNHGRIEAVGTPREVVERPKTAFVARFLGYNVLEGTITNIVSPTTGSGHASEIQVQIALDGGLNVWGIAVDAVTCRVGSSAVLCVRREHVRLKPASTEVVRQIEPRDPGREQCYAGRIRTSSFLGLHQEYVVDLGGNELRVVGEPIAGDGSVIATVRNHECLIVAKTAE